MPKVQSFGHIAVIFTIGLYNNLFNRFIFVHNFDTNRQVNLIDLRIWVILKYVITACYYFSDLHAHVPLQSTIVQL
jgi:hypothetical protein